MRTLALTQGVIHTIFRTQLSGFLLITRTINMTWSVLNTRNEDNYVVSVYINSKLKLNFCWQLENFLSIHLCGSDTKIWDSLHWSEACRLLTKHSSETQSGEMTSNLKGWYRENMSRMYDVAASLWSIWAAYWLRHRGTACWEPEIQVHFTHHFLLLERGGSNDLPNVFSGTKLLYTKLLKQILTSM